MTQDTKAAPTFRGPAALEQIDLLITEHVFGWRWYKLTPAGVAMARAQDEMDGEPNRAHLVDGSRFLSDPLYGGGEVIKGTFELLGAAAIVALPIARGMAQRVLPVTKNMGLATLALERCESITYRKTWWPKDGKDGYRYWIECARSHLPTSRVGHAEADEYAEAAALAVASAYGLI